MNALKHLRLLSLAAGLIVAGGCATNPPPRSGVVYVRERPPREVVEVIAVAPSPAHVWIAGHHAWRGNAYVWIPGYYELPGSGFRVWEPGRWVHDRHGWYYVDGRWR